MKLTVREFSCIDYAEIELQRLTILIGPQASGKSVISKLVYFFTELLTYQVEYPRLETSLDRFIQHIENDFRRWFPASAWGSNRFQIDFQVGDFSINITRKRRYKKESPDFVVTLSDEFLEFFNSVAKTIYEARKASGSITDTPSSRWQLLYEVKNEAVERLRGLLGSEFIQYQLFVPAGRSFFTSTGKAIAVFEQSGMLDPTTLSFGRFWASTRDDSHYLEEVEGNIKEELMYELFGGQLKADGEKEYVQSEDGRRVPLTALSSGQQELLPLLMAISAFFPDRHDLYGSMMLYIEEPEAHLFPHAQSKLIELLTSKLYGGSSRRMLITTHSPYVLTKFNNLIKASIVARGASESVQRHIANIVPRSAWIKTEDVAAYAILDRKVVSIIDEDGLIDANYLDEVSSALMDDFSDLLDIQYG